MNNPHVQCCQSVAASTVPKLAASASQDPRNHQHPVQKGISHCKMKGAHDDARNAKNHYRNSDFPPMCGLVVMQCLNIATSQEKRKYPAFLLVRNRKAMPLFFSRCMALQEESTQSRKLRKNSHLAKLRSFSLPPPRNPVHRFQFIP